MSGLYQGRVFQVYREKIKLPNGNQMSVDVLKHPGAVLIVPIHKDNTIVMLRQYRPVIKQYLYELPAGTVDNQESVLKTAKRELIEETGFSSTVWKKLGQIIPVPGYSTEKITIFSARNLTPTAMAHEPDEVIQVLTLSPSQIVRLVKNKKIVDAKTICALYFAGVLS